MHLPNLQYLEKFVSDHKDAGQLDWLGRVIDPQKPVIFANTVSFIEIVIEFSWEGSFR